MYLSTEDFHYNGLKHYPKISHILAQGSGRLMEDFCLLGQNTFGVFDGATSLVADTFKNGMTGGRIAAGIAANIFKNSRLDLRETARLVNDTLLKEMLVHKTDLSGKETLWSTSAAVLKIAGERIEWCQIGDCQILMIYHDNSHKLLVDDTNHDVETLCSWKKRCLSTNGLIKDVMAEEILQVRQRMNIDYGVFNGEPMAMEFLQTGSESLAGVSDILLYSDGLYLPQHDPRAAQNMDLFVELYQEAGLENIHEYVKAVQLRDPACRSYPRFKTHDDVSAIALKWG